MFGFSIGASKIDLGEFTESNGHVCDDALSVLGGSGLVVVKCLQNKIYFKLITYNVFACANSDAHSSFTLCHHSWTKIQY
jgi:hypothetical protein